VNFLGTTNRLAPCAAKAQEIRTADSTDFTDFEEVIGDDRTSLFVAKLQGLANRSLSYLRNLRNRWLNPFSVFGIISRLDDIPLLQSWVSWCTDPGFRSAAPGLSSLAPLARSISLAPHS